METRTARLVGVGVLFLRIISAYIHTYTRVESCKQINIIYLVPCKMYSSYTEKKKKKKTRSYAKVKKKINGTHRHKHAAGSQRPIPCA